jgi:hypothetical protein
MDNFQLSEHFSFFELTGSGEHPGLVEDNRIDAQAYIHSLSDVCKILLEPVRAQFGPVVVTSGFRGKALNAAVGGAATSQHALGQAADIEVPGRTVDEVFNWIHRSNLPFGQLIIENAGGKQWVHVSLGEPYRPIERCREALKFDGHEYVAAPFI